MNPDSVCILCGSSNTRTLQVLQSSTIINRWQEIYQIDVTSEFSGVTEFVLRECKSCFLRYFSPQSLTGSAALYMALDRFDWYYLPGKWEHLQAIADIRGCHSGVEIGCGFGDFIELAKRSTGIEIQGLEKNPEAIEEARRRGVVLNPSDLSDLVKSSAGKYDAVCSFQVLEHVASPGEFLRLCCELLAPKGRLILGLPNADSFLRFQANILDLPPHHISRWPVATIQSLGDFFPLRLLRLDFEPLTEIHLPGYVEAHCNRLAGSIFAFAAHPFLQSRIIRVLKSTGLRKLLRGQAVYAAFERS